MFEKIKKGADYLSLGATVLFLISLFLDIWKLSAFLLLVVIIAVNTATYMEMQKKTNPVAGMLEGLGDVFKGQK